jgi:hypothetical protein
MNLAAIFLLLVQSGACAQTQFQSADGATLAVLVCPRVVAPDAEEPAPKAPERRT